MSITERLYRWYSSWRAPARRSGSGAPPRPAGALPELTVALVTMAGIRLREQPAFDTANGDHSFRIIPATATADDLIVDHAHYDTGPASRDPECVFPLQSLAHLAAAGVVGSPAPLHFGLMGYILNPEALLRETVPALLAALRAAGTDVVLLSAGSYVCHRSAGLLHGALEEAGMPVVSVTHRPRLTARLGVSRSALAPWPMGQAYGPPGQTAVHRAVVRSALSLLSGDFACAMVRLGKDGTLPTSPAGRGNG